MRTFHGTTRFDRGPYRSEDGPSVKYRRKNVTLHALISRYLCAGRKSPCVKTGRCECLSRCVYGRQYIAMRTEEQKDG